MTLQIPEAKCRLHVAMAAWPEVDACTASFLRGLHWRIRRIVVLTHGEEYTQDQVSARMRVSVATVRSDLQRAYDAFDEACPE